MAPCKACPSPCVWRLKNGARGRISRRICRATALGLHRAGPRGPAVGRLAPDRTRLRIAARSDKARAAVGADKIPQRRLYPGCNRFQADGAEVMNYVSQPHRIATGVLPDQTGSALFPIFDHDGVAQSLCRSALSRQRVSGAVTLGDFAGAKLGCLRKMDHFRCISRRIVELFGI